MAEASGMDIDDVEQQGPSFNTTTGDHFEHQPTDTETAPASNSFAGQNEIISQLEVDSNRSDNDSSLGSEITS